MTNNAGFDARAHTSLSGATVPLPSLSRSVQNLTVTALVPGATYWFAIRARDQANNSANWNQSLAANATNYARSGLQSVTSLVGSTVSATSLRWNWTDISGETGYQIVTDSGGIVSGTLAVNTSYYTELGIVPNTLASRQVKALFDTLSSLSAAATQYTLSNPPTGTTISSVTISTVTIFWSANSNSTGTVTVRRATFTPVTVSVSLATRSGAGDELWTWFALRGRDLLLQCAH